jgi:uncharacterized protein
MDDLSVISRPKPVSSRVETIQRLRAHEGDIRRHFVTALYLFGSAARDELYLDSDIDVFVDYDADAFTFVQLLRLPQVLEAALGRRVDFMTRDGIHPRLRSDIERSSVRVF